MTAPLVHPSPDGSWLASTRAGVHAVLGDARFVVPEAGPPGPVGTIAWLRAAVSRFANGPVHEQRRDIVLRLLADISPDALRIDAWRRAASLLNATEAVSGGGDLGGGGTALVRLVPTVTLAAALGAARPEAVAAAVPACAAGYFPSADDDRVRAADLATAELVSLLRRGDDDVAATDEVVAGRMALLVQGFQAGVDLISAMVRVLPAIPPDAAGRSSHLRGGAAGVPGRGARAGPDRRCARRAPRVRRHHRVIRRPARRIWPADRRTSPGSPRAHHPWGARVAADPDMCCRGSVLRR